jgi:hypothetical protein
MSVARYEGGDAGKMRARWTALGLPLLDNRRSGLAVAGAEVYLDGSAPSMLVYISYHLFPAHVHGSSEACCCGGKSWQHGCTHVHETSRLQDKDWDNN